MMVYYVYVCRGDGHVKVYDTLSSFDILGPVVMRRVHAVDVALVLGLHVMLKLGVQRRLRTMAVGRRDRGRVFRDGPSARRETAPVLLLRQNGG